MKAIIRFQFVSISVFALSIGGFAASSSEAQSLHHRLAPPPAITVQKKPMPMLTPAIAMKRDEQTGKITQVFPQQALDVYDHGDPTAEEQYIMEMINRARANPTAEGIRLANSTDPDVVDSYSYWASQGAPFATPANVKSAFATYPAKPPLAFNKDLLAAARDHSQDMIDHNFQGHNGSNGSTLTDRLTSAGYIGWDGAGENVAAYSNSIEFTEDGLEIDFGQQNQTVLGHRQNITNFTGTIFTEIGIGALHGGAGVPDVGTIVTTQDFGHIPGNVFITESSMETIIRIIFMISEKGFQA